MKTVVVSRPYRMAWWASALALAVAGAIAMAFGATPEVCALALVPSLLIFVGLLVGGTGATTIAAIALACAGVIAAAFLAPRAWMPAILAAFAQAALCVVTWPTPRGWGLRAMRGIGHALAAGGAALAVASGFVAGIVPVAAVCAATGLSLLIVVAFWARRERGITDPGWETVMLVAVLLAIVAGSMPYLAHLGLGHTARLGWAFATIAAAAAAFALCAPIPAPRWLRVRQGTTVETLSHGIAALVFVNALFLSYSLVAQWSLRTIMALLLGWTAIVVHLEYRSIKHHEGALRAGRLDVIPLDVPPDAPTVTVVVPCMDEEAVLAQTLAENLAIPYPLRFIVVPAMSSRDGTVEVARSVAAQHPDRVRVVLGTTGSKAEDLNLAWSHIDTELVIILDADETTDASSIVRALTIMRERPEVGIVQGRKVSRDPEVSATARFACTERRYSTGMDSLLHAQRFGSSHFGGSGAMLRREVPPELGGWTTQSMVEDIDFTLRTHLRTGWVIAYETRMVVRESDPATFGDLLRQRTRWGRGWIQCTGLYFREVVERRKHLGARRTMGILWLLLTCICALWTTLLPATILLRLAGLGFWLPAKVALMALAIFLPARLISYGYNAARDPVIPLRRTPARMLEFAWHAYAWIFVGWMIQLNALYLEVASAPRVWHVTGKTTAAGSGGRAVGGSPRATGRAA
jgi:cellulose synthase/poly-beta-1,6-N-acetylglucosamine synthase-like glycosyltransferase